MPLIPRILHTNKGKQHYPRDEWVEAEPYFIFGSPEFYKEIAGQESNGKDQPQEFLRALRGDLVSRFTMSGPTIACEEVEDGTKIYHFRYLLLNYSPPVMLTIVRLDHPFSEQHPEGGTGFTLKATYWGRGGFSEKDLQEIAERNHLKPRSKFPKPAPRQ